MSWNYTNPGWTNNSAPPQLNAENLSAISGALEQMTITDEQLSTLGATQNYKLGDILTGLSGGGGNVADGPKNIAWSIGIDFDSGTTLVPSTISDMWTLIQSDGVPYQIVGKCICYDYVYPGRYAPYMYIFLPKEYASYPLEFDSTTHMPTISTPNGDYKISATVTLMYRDTSSASTLTGMNFVTLLDASNPPSEGHLFFQTTSSSDFSYATTQLSNYWPTFTEKSDAFIYFKILMTKSS